MLSGFECDEDQTGWVAGVAVWSTGAAAGCLLAVATVGNPLVHGQVLALAILISLVSLGLRLPVMLSTCPSREWLVHAVWMLGFFAQVNWAGFLAARSATNTIGLEAIAICLGLEVWLVVHFAMLGKLPWLKNLIIGEMVMSDETSEEPLTSAVIGLKENSSDSKPLKLTIETEDEMEAPGEILREFVDGLDENGQRYLSGSVRVAFEKQQRTEYFVLSFCPAFSKVPSVELECDSEWASAAVENVTESGARIAIRRRLGNDPTDEAQSIVTVDWFANLAEDCEPVAPARLP